MRRVHRFVLVALVSAPLASPSFAQTPPTPTGHWEGSITVPDRTVKVEVDIAKNAKGEFIGTFTNPAENIRGLPFAAVAADGKSVRLVLKAGAGGGNFEGVLSDDGRAIAGNFVTTEGGHALPFTLSRTGDARIEAPARSAPIGKEFEGTWSGAIDANGAQIRLALTMANQADGTSTITLILVDRGVEIPATITQKGAGLTLEAKTVGGTYAGTLSADRTELAGTWKQGQHALPLTLKRAAPPPL